MTCIVAPALNSDGCVQIANEMEPTVTLIILGVAGLGVATVYAVAGQTLRRMLRREAAKPSL